MASSIDLEQIMATADLLRGANLQSRSIEWIEEKFSAISSQYDAFGASQTSNQLWHRARKCKSKDGFSSLQELLYRPSESVDIGRANLPGSSVLYASRNVHTAFDEIGAEAGEYVQVVVLRPVLNVEIPCHVVGEYQNIVNSGRSLIDAHAIEINVGRMMRDDYPRYMRTLYIDAFFADSFRKRVNRSYEYKATAVFSERFHKGNGGLLYPSVQTAGDINVAVPGRVFDANFEVLFTDIHKIEHSYGYGLYDNWVCRHSCDFDSDGTIKWDSKKRLKLRFNFREGLRVLDPHVGWQKPGYDHSLRWTPEKVNAHTT